MASASNTFRSSEDFRRRKELEEARKAGLAPAEVDEDGNVINPHIPQFMASAPWYLSQGPGLKHQKDWRDKLADGERWYDRGAKIFQATKWRKGACENCGAMSHKTKDCLERPRAKGAKFTNKNIAPDEKVEEITLHGFDSKRDRYNGYDAAEYAKVVERYEQLEAVRREIKVKEVLEAAAKEAEEGERGKADGVVPEDAAAGVDVDEDVKIDDAEDAAFGEVKKRVRTTAGGSSGSVRNLRIREDTAKYLLNLDVNSAHYDPKSRSMREDPLPHKPLEEKNFAGDNFVRKTGDYEAWQALNLHALTAQAKGQDIHLQALPSAAELLHQQFRQKKEVLQKKQVQSVLDKYGSAGKAPSAAEEALLLSASEHYVEYDRSGRVIKGQEIKARSKYEEDVLVNNHTSVWGSWWHDGAWGYACCRQAVKNSYCLGTSGAEAKEAQEAQMLKNIEAKVKQMQQTRDDQAQQVQAQQQQQDESGSDEMQQQQQQQKADGSAHRKREAGPSGSSSSSSSGADSSSSGSSSSSESDSGSGSDSDSRRRRTKRRSSKHKGKKASKTGGEDKAKAGKQAGWGAEAPEDLELDAKKLKAALKRQEQQMQRDVSDDRKRGFNSLAADQLEVTEEDMEAYRLKRARGDDPMAQPGGGTNGYEML